MQLLAFEAITRAGSALAVGEGGQELAYRALAPGRAAAELPLVLHQLIEAHGRPRALAVAAGPGSFTGLRVAVVAARTLAWLEGIAIHPVDSMQAIAASAGPGCWRVLLPLKKDTTFHACYRLDGETCEILVPPTPCLDRERPESTVAEAVVIGPALREKPGLAAAWFPGSAQGAALDCDARSVARAAAWTPPLEAAQLLPRYGIASAPELQRRRDRGVA